MGLTCTAFILALGLISRWSAEESRTIKPPMVAMFHVFFWLVQLLYARTNPVVVGAVAYGRLHSNQGYMSLAWILLGFAGGSEPGSAWAKLWLFFLAACVIVARLYLLAAALAEEKQEMGDELLDAGIRVLVIANLVGGTLGILARKRWDAWVAHSQQLRRELDALAKQTASLERHTADLERVIARRIHPCRTRRTATCKATQRAALCGLLRALSP